METYGVNEHSRDGLQPPRQSPPSQFTDYLASASSNAKDGLQLTHDSESKLHKLRDNEAGVSLEKLSNTAARIRNSFDIRQVLYYFVCALAIISLTIVLGNCAGFISSPPNNKLMSADDSSLVLFWLSVFSLMLLSIFHWALIFLGGWHYRFSRPISAKRGLPRAWYNAMKNVGKEKEELEAGGFTQSFSFAWKAKHSSLNFTFLFLLFFLLFISCFTIETFNLEQEAFLLNADGIVENNVNLLRRAFASLAGETAHDTTLDERLSLAIYMFPSLIGVVYTMLLVSKASTIRWALLPLSETLWEYLYYHEKFKHIQEAAYTDDDAQDDAFRWILKYAMQKAPEEFFSRTGEVFFLEEDTAQDFHRFAREVGRDRSASNGGMDRTYPCQSRLRRGAASRKKPAAIR